MMPHCRLAEMMTVLAVVAGCSAHAASSDELQGVVEYDERRLGFPLGGVIASVDVVEGQRIAVGDPLATVDDRFERAQRDGRAAELATALAHLALLEAGTRSELVAQTRARLAGAATTERSAARQLEDERQLSEAGAVPASGVIEREAAFAEARATRRSLEQELRAMRGGARPEEIAAARASVEAARARVAASDARLTQHALGSPTAGIVLDVHAHGGEVTSAGTPVITIADTTRPFVDVFVPETKIAAIVIGATAEIRVDSLSKALPGVVEHIARRVEFTPSYVFSPKERTNLVVRVRVRLAPAAGVQVPAGVPAFVTVAGLP
jgi:HlyD family secretion protein